MMLNSALIVRLYMSAKLEKNYYPSESEEYMNPKQIEYFKHKLLSWKSDLLNDSQDTIKHLKEDSMHESDINDRATIEMETSLELKTRDRYRKLLDKIDSALKRIESEEYGYCEETGEEIGIKRLEARPIATLSIEAQQKHENYERQHSDLD